MLNATPKAIRRAARFFRARRGVFAVEFGFLIPIFSLALLAGIELTRFALMNQKMDRVSGSSSNMSGLSDGTMSCADLDNIWKSAENIAKPFGLGANGVVVISFIEAETVTNYRIKWQRRGAGTLTNPSKFGVEGGLATMPAGFAMVVGETVLVAEVFSLYDPLVFSALVPSQVVYRTTLDRPRFVNSITLDVPTCP
jgi:Flp pilus assembly protein TadG